MHLNQQPIDVDRPWLQCLAAGEGEHSMGQLRPPLGRAQNHLGHLSKARVVFSFLAYDLGAAQNHSEQIVEVVSDASSQLADRLHFLSLAELLLQLPPLRDVAEGPDPAVEFECLISDRIRVSFQDRTVDQFHLVPVDFLRMGIQMIYLLFKLNRVLHDGFNELNLVSVVRVLHNLWGNLQQFVHPLVLEDLRSPAVHHQYSVQRRVYLGFKEGRSRAKFFIRLAAILFMSIDFQRETDVHCQLVQQLDFVLVEKRQFA